MKIGVPREIKIQEHRVGLVPSAVRELVADGHQLVVESGAGLGIGCADSEYQRAGAVPRTSAFALNNATLPYVRALAGKGWQRATVDDPGLAAGLNVLQGRVVHPVVAQALGFGN